MDDAPHEVGVEPVDGGLPRDQRVEAVNPVLVEEVEPGGAGGEQDEDGEG